MQTENAILKAQIGKAANAAEIATWSKGPAIHASQHDRSSRVIEAAFCVQRGLPTEQLERDYGAQVLEAAHREFRGRLGLQQAILMAAAEHGYVCRPGERITRGNIGEIMHYALPPIHAAPSSISMSGILSNVANKDLRFGYEQEDQSWREIGGVKSVSDFKQATSYRMLDSLEYEELGPAGEIKHGTAGQESYTRQAKTYAKMFVLTRTDIINDDLGAFDDLRNRIGRGAAQKFNNVFWATFMDNSTFFTSGRGNYISGATTNLLTDGVGLEAAVLAFRQLRSPTADGAKRISGEPALLLVPPELEFVARKLYKSTNVISGGASSVDVAMGANVHEGLYRPIIVPWLSDSAFTGYSTTAWYLLRDQRAGLNCIVASFLDGMQAPTVESSETEFNTLGMQFRGYHDFGCDLAEYMGGVKSKGAA